MTTMTAVANVRCVNKRFTAHTRSDMAGVNDIPPQARGTVKFGGFDYHYRRSLITNQLYVVRGPDTRDWQAIDAGAIDYADIAYMEHQSEPFGGHDGPKITASCPICNGQEGAAATKDPDAALVALARQGNKQAMDRAVAKGLIGAQPPPGDTLVVPKEIPPDRQAVLDAAAAARADQAEAEAAQARADQAAKEAMNAELNNAVAAAEAAGINTARREGEVGDAYVNRLRAAVATGPETAAASPQTVTVTATTTNATNADAGLTVSGLTPPEGYGRDPWTSEVVKITRNEGADADAPYGRKRDNTPRRRSIGGRPKAQ